MHPSRSPIGLSKDALTASSARQKQTIMQSFILALLLCAGIGFDLDHVRAADYEQSQPDQIVLLHGIGKSSRSMQKLANNLERAGYHVLNLSYPSTHFTIEAQTAHVTPLIRSTFSPSITTHFVGHSMGGLVAISTAQNLPDFSIGRMVQLGTPNFGSEVADWLVKNPIYQRFYGPAGAQLTTRAQKPAANARLPYELGIIAGSATIDPISSMIIPGKDDGKVAVLRTVHPAMQDHITIAVAHPFLPGSAQAGSQVKYFLKHGKFNRN